MKEKYRRILNTLTIDVEEWYQTVLFCNDGEKYSQGSNLEENVREILFLLKKYKAIATFFIVGSVAEKYPRLVQEIKDDGHEIATHGYSHVSVNKLSQKEFISDVRRSIESLAGITKEEVWGYRAPTWSITKEMPWAIDVLSSIGLKYDSSIYPVGLNFPEKECIPYKIRDNLFEFPPSIFKAVFCNFPYAGGTFLRFLPLKFIKNRIAQINYKGYTAMIYFHSWEFDREIPYAGISLWKRFVQYQNVHSVRYKIESLLNDFRFTSIKEQMSLNALA